MNASKVTLTGFSQRDDVQTDGQRYVMMLALNKEKRGLEPRNEDSL